MVFVWPVSWLVVIMSAALVMSRGLFLEGVCVFTMMESQNGVVIESWVPTWSGQVHLVWMFWDAVENAVDNVVPGRGCLFVRDPVKRHQLNT